MGIMAEQIQVVLDRELDEKLERALPPHFRGRKAAMRFEHVAREWLEDRTEGCDLKSERN